jgi:uncharacterized protein with PIN domain
MDQAQFMNLVWRLEEILMHRDHLKQQIGKCVGQCEGYDADEDEGLCPKCCEVLVQVQKEEERLQGNKELDEILKKLKNACDEDKTGRYQRILEQSREGKVIQ